MKYFNEQVIEEISFGDKKFQADLISTFVKQVDKESKIIKTERFVKI